MSDGMAKDGATNDAVSTQVIRLASACLLQEIDEVDVEQLNKLLAEDDTARHTYLRFMCDSHKLRSWAEGQYDPGDSQWTGTDSPAVAKEEKVVRAPRNEGLVSRSLRHEFGVGVSAAIIVVLGIVVWAAMTYLPNVATKQQKPVETKWVALLNNRFDAEWIEDTEPAPNHPRLVPGQRLAVSAGLLEINYRTGAVVVIEGPAEFIVGSQASAAHEASLPEVTPAKGAEHDCSGFLRFGKLVARVESSEAIGFCIETPTTNIVDLGTEFGVAVSKAGSTDVSVFEGSLRLHGKGDASEAGSVLLEGDVARVDETGRRRDSNDASPAVFVRRMPVPLRIDLVDIVAGGDGKGTGKPGFGIDPASGKSTQERRVAIDADVSPQGERYHSVPLPMVDGVFVPAAARAGETTLRQQVSSTGILADLPATDGRAWTDIVHGSHVPFSTIIGSINYTSGKNTLLSMHANCAITFDLDAVRNQYGAHVLRQFSAIVGDVAQLGGRAEVAILVDGRPAKKITLKHAQSPNRVIADIDDADRFLTIVVTDGGDSYSHDQVALGNPTLVMYSAIDIERLATDDQ